MPIKPVKALFSSDDDAIRVVMIFSEVKPSVQSASTLLEKLLARAERVGLHRMTDEQFEAAVERLSGSLASSS